MDQPLANLSEVAKKRIKALGGSDYMAQLAKKKAKKMTPAERRAHSLKMHEAKKLKSSSATPTKG